MDNNVIEAQQQQEQMDEVSRELGLDELNSNEPAPQVLAGGIDEADSEDESELEASFFDDEDEYFGTPNKPRKGYTARVKIGPMTFFIIEAPREIIAAYNRANADIARELNAIEVESKRLASEEGLDEVLVRMKQENLQKRAETTTARMVEANTRVIEACVRDWNNPQWPRRRPCNTASRARLSPSRKAELVDLILQKTQTGRAASDRLLAS